MLHFMHLTPDSIVRGRGEGGGKRGEGRGSEIFSALKQTAFFKTWGVCKCTVEKSINSLNFRSFFVGVVIGKLKTL